MGTHLARRHAAAPGYEWTPLNGHALGANLLISDLLAASATIPVEGSVASSAQGRVLPMSSTPIDIEADMNDGGRRYVVSGSQVAVAPGTVEHVHHAREAPTGSRRGHRAISKADWSGPLGPGSWYTSRDPAPAGPGH